MPIKPAIRNVPSETLSLRESLVSWMSGYLEKSGKSGFVLGLSGGVDSSVLALLARDATQRSGKRLLALLLPINSDYYDEKTAREVCEKYGIEYKVMDLKPVYDSWRGILPEAEDPVVHTNLKARLRESAMYYCANSMNLLVLGTVNKGELAIGYFPKNASAGDLLPLGDILKREIRDIGASYELPEHVVQAKASGCIWAATAEEEWGFSEDELDEMVFALDAGPDTVMRLNRIDKDKRLRFLEIHRESAHKREYYPIFRRRNDK